LALAIVNNQSIEKEAYHYNTHDANPDLGDNTYRVKSKGSKDVVKPVVIAH
jgi:hypothetical protein